MADKTTIYLEDILEEIFFQVEQNDFKQAKYLLKKAIKKYPRHYLTFFGQGMYAGLSGDNETAIFYLKQCVANNPCYAIGQHNLAVSYQKTNRPDLSIKHHYLALKNATEDEEELITASQDIIDTIEQSLPDGFTIEDYFADAGRFERAFEFMVEQRYAQAAELFHLVANNQSSHVQARGNLGICYLMLADYQKAKAYLQQAIALDKHYQPAHDNLLVLKNIESGKLEKPLGMRQTDYYAEKVNLSE